MKHQIELINGTGEPGIKDRGHENGTKIDLDGKGKKPDETISDFQIDESPPQRHCVHSDDVNASEYAYWELNEGEETVKSATKEIAFGDETAAGLRIRKYKYDASINYDNLSEEEKKDLEREETEVTIQLDEGSIENDGEKVISGFYEGGFLNPEGLEGDYTSEEGAQVKVYEKEKAYITGITPEEAAEKYTFRIEKGKEIYISHLIPGTYTIREVDSDSLQRVEITTDNSNGSDTETKVIKANTESEEDSIEKARNEGVKINTRKKEWHHGLVELWNGESANQVTIIKKDKEGNLLKDAIFAMKLIEGPKNGNTDGSDTTTEGKDYVGKYVNPKALHEKDGSSGPTSPDGKDTGSKILYLDKEGKQSKEEPYIDGDPNTEAVENQEPTDENLKAAIETYGIKIENGKLTIKNLSPGTYEIWELQAPEDYIRLKESKKAVASTVTTDGEEQEAPKDDSGEILSNSVEFINIEAGKITIHKVDKDLKFLPGAVFAIKYETAVEDENSDDGKEWEGKYINPEALEDVTDSKISPGGTDNVEEEVKRLIKDKDGIDPYKDGDANTTAVEEGSPTDENLEAAIKGYGITAETGKLTIKNLFPGTYKIYELKAPEVEGSNFLRLKEPAEAISMTTGEAEGGEKKDLVVIENKESGEIEVEKQDENKKPLKDAYIALKLKTVDENAVANETLLQKYKALEGSFVLTSALTEVTSNSAGGQSQGQGQDQGQEENKGKVYKLNDENDYANSYKEITGELSEHKDEIGIVTDESGKFIVKNLIPGTYNVIEIEAPAGYIIPDNHKDGGEGEVVNTEAESETSQEGSSKATIVNTPEKGGGIRIIKYDQDDEEILLSGAKFTIQYVEAPADSDSDSYSDYLNKYVAQVGRVDRTKLDEYYIDEKRELSTNREGKIEIYNLLPGTYKIEETEAPPDYEKVEESIDDIVIESQPATSGDKDQEEDVQEAKVANKIKSDSNLDIEKRDAETGEIINSPVQVEISYRSSGGVGEWLDSSGNYSKSPGTTVEFTGTKHFDHLKAGTYTIKEISPPDGYELNQATFIERLSGEPEDKDPVVIYDNKTSTTTPTPTPTPRTPGTPVTATESDPEVGIYKMIEGTGKGLEYFRFNIEVMDIDKEGYDDITNPTSHEAGDRNCGSDHEHVSKEEAHTESYVEEHWYGDYYIGTNGGKSFNPITTTCSKAEQYHMEQQGVNEDGSPNMVKVHDWWYCAQHPSVTDIGGVDEYGYGLDEHIQHWNAGAKEFNQAVSNANSAHAKRMKAIEDNTITTSTGPHEVVTDKNGFANLKFLAETDEELDGHGRYEIKERSVGYNPYFDVEVNKNTLTGCDSWVLHTFYNKRLRVDIEGLIWDDTPEAKKSGVDGGNSGDHYWKGQPLMSPIEVKLFRANGELLGSVVTTDGRYSIRVYMPYSEPSMKQYLQGAYVEFIYNGLKYQSVYEPKLEEETGSKALESLSERQRVNETLQTIISNNGQTEVNAPKYGDFSINYEKYGEYQRRVKYEGQVEGGDRPVSGTAADTIGNGHYSLGAQKVKHSEMDPKTQQEWVYEPEKDNPFADHVFDYTKRYEPEVVNKYQITATTGTDGANYQGFNEYRLEDDKISNVNLGLYEREQPDISLVNDIQQAIININGYSYIYKYGNKTQTPDSEELFSGIKTVKVRFENNMDYQYKREVYPSDVQVIPNNNPEEGRLQIHVRYRTIIKNESTGVKMVPNEIVSHYDARYTQVTDVTQEMIQDGETAAEPAGAQWVDSSSDVRSNNVKPTGESKHGTEEGMVVDVSAGALKTKYREVTNEIDPGQSIVMYTDYLLPREPCIDMFTGSEGGRTLLIFNYVEINQYTTLKYGQNSICHESLYDGPAYAGVDKDSAVGNGTPGQVDATYDDDFDEAPVFQLSLTDRGNRILRGNVFDDLASESDSSVRADLKQWLGDGENGSGDKPVNKVIVELIEIVNGQEDLNGGDPRGDTKAILDSSEWDYDDLIFGSKENPDLSGNYTSKAQKITTGSPDNRLAYSETGQGFTSKCHSEESGSDATSDGDYILDGYIPGKYLIRFTWGQNSEIVGKTLTIDGKDTGYQAKAWPTQYKNTWFKGKAGEEGLERYNRYKSNPRWYLENSHRNLSNALDVTSIRKEIDEKMKTVGYGNDDKTFTNVEKDEEPYNIKMQSKTVQFEIPIEDDTDAQPNDDLTEASDGQGKNDRYFEIVNMDFGIVERPKTKMTIDKRIDRAKVVLRNGTTLFDATVVEDTTPGSGGWKLEGPSAGGVYLDPVKDDNPATADDIGTMKFEIDKEILKGSTLEITYRYTIKNESYLDYVVQDNSGAGDTISEASNFGVSPEGNSYYYWQTTSDTGPEVEIQPNKIVDYLDNDMNYLKRPSDSGAPTDNDLWERIVDGNDESFRNDSSYVNAQADRIKDWLFSESDKTALYDAAEGAGVYYQKYAQALNVANRLARINKMYWTLLRDQTDDGEANRGMLPSDPGLDPDWEISLKAKEQEEIKFIASKKMDNTDTDDMEYNNTLEILQVGKNGGALPEGEVYGNGHQPEIEFLDLSHETNPDPSVTPEGPWETSDPTTAANIEPPKELDESTAATFVFTPPTGDDTMYKQALTKIITIAILCVTATGIALIRAKVVKVKAGRPKKIGKQKKKRNSKDE